VDIEGKFAYVLAGTGIGNPPPASALHVLSAATPWESRVIGTLDDLPQALALAVKDGYVYIVCREPSLSMLVIDASWGLTPALLATLPLGGAADRAGISVTGDRAWVAGPNGVTYVIDIERPEAPKLLHRLSVDQWVADPDVVDVAGDDDHALVLTHKDVLVFDAAGRGENGPEPLSIHHLDVSSGDAQRLTLDGDNAHVVKRGGNVEVLDISDPREPQPLAHYSNPTEGGGSYTIAAQDDVVLVTGEDAGLSLLRVARTPPDGRPYQLYLPAARNRF
jgi:hypothetical protein